jgi:1-acyl-sn-glycerol-3-phosphate acyltransferase
MKSQAASFASTQTCAEPGCACASVTERVTDTVRPVGRLVGIVGWSAFMISWVDLAELCAPRDQRDAVFFRYMKRWARGLMRLYGVELLVASEPAADARGARLVASNHRSVIDIAILLAHFGGVPLARADIRRWPFLGWVARRAHCIFVDRDAKNSRSNAVAVIREKLAENVTVVVFPEGTVQPGDTLLPFKRGAFAAALEHGAEIVPVGVAYPRECEWGEESFLEHAVAVGHRRRTPVAMAIGAPLMPTGTVDELADRVQAEVQALVAQARAALESAR